jgi:hypothetical protein
MDGAVLLPQQLQRHSWPTQLAVDRRPPRLRPTLTDRNRRRRVDPALQLLYATASILDGNNKSAFPVIAASPRPTA